MFESRWILFVPFYMHRCVCGWYHWNNKRCTLPDGRWNITSKNHIRSRRPAYDASPPVDMLLHILGHIYNVCLFVTTSYCCTFIVIKDSIDKRSVVFDELSVSSFHSERIMPCTLIDWLIDCPKANAIIATTAVCVHKWKNTALKAMSQSIKYFITFLIRFDFYHEAYTFVLKKKNVTLSDWISETLVGSRLSNRTVGLDLRSACGALDVSIESEVLHSLWRPTGRNIFRLDTGSFTSSSSK